MDKIGDIKKAFDLGDCGEGKKRSLRQKPQFAAKTGCIGQAVCPCHQSPSRAKALHAEPQQSSSSACVGWRGELGGNGAGRRETNSEVPPLNLERPSFGSGPRKRQTCRFRGCIL